MSPVSTANSRLVYDALKASGVRLMSVEIESGITRAAFNRGAATIYNGKVFRVTIDNHLLALDMKTGRQQSRQSI